MTKIKVFDGINVNFEFNKNIRKNNLPVLVFIHPWANNLTVWDNEIKYLNKKGFSTLRYDIRGHGLSDEPLHKNSYTLSSLATEIKDIIESLKIKKVILIAHSFGGMIALKYYMQNRKNVEKIIFIDAIFSAPQNLEAFKEPTEFLRGIIEKMNKQNIAKSNNAVEFNFSSNHKNQLLCDAEQFIETPLFTIIETAKMIYNTDLKSSLNKIDCPVLVIQGDSDSLTPLQKQKTLFSRVKNMKFVRLNHGQHNLITEHPLAISRIIEDFTEDNKKSD
jgi:pimeloyl-ACP methyl ester carboxylesterase